MESFLLLLINGIVYQLIEERYVHWCASIFSVQNQRSLTENAQNYELLLDENKFIILDFTC